MPAVFLPSVFVGIPSPVLTKLAINADEPARAGRTIGAFYAIGAIGSIAGTLAAGFVFIAWLGTTHTMLVVGVLYFAMVAVLFADRGIGDAQLHRLPLFVAGAAIVH